MNSSQEGAAAGGAGGANGTGGRPAPLSWKWKAALSAVAVVVVALIFWPRGQESSAPGGLLYDDGGRPAPSGSRMAPVTLIHFWATWCPPCIQETPAIQRLAKDLADRQDFALLMIAVADRKEKVDRFLGPAAAMALFDPNWDVAHRYGTSQLPETYLVVKGKVVQKFIGATDWDNPEVRRGLLAYLGGGPVKPAVQSNHLAVERRKGAR
ncbi:MAG TPA: TlpA disulfide reductase family protein [Thermoanaerobaculia bacterium]|nr:TlpA disulfide reductase family protein [Thermoanaerobaculia bacterium]